MLIRRSVLYLFVLLQCLAPLLHAHAGGPLHAGCHLPDSVGAHSFAGDSIHTTALPENLTVTLANSLQARNALPLANPAGPILCLPASGFVEATWIPAPTPRPYALTARHLIPLPGAPPRS